MPLAQNLSIGNRRLWTMLSPRRQSLEAFTGLDLLSAIEDAPANKLIQAKNVEFRNGRARARPGYRAVTGLPAFNFTHFYYSKTFDYLYMFEEKVGGKIYRTNDLSLTGTFTDVTGTLTMTGEGVGAIDFNGALVVVTVNGVWASTNGTSWTLQTSSVVGNEIVSWQNKLWVARVYAGTFGSIPNAQRVWRSNIGSYATWTTATDWVDIREGVQSDAPLSALHVTQSDDSTGKPSLLVAKQRSLHRINDATTGSFTTLSEGIGVLTKSSIASGQGRTVFISERGIFATDGASTPVEIGAPVRPLFSTKIASGLNYLFAPAVSFGNRFLFSIPGWDPVASTYQNSVAVVHLEWDTDSGAWSTHTFPANGADDVMAYFVLPPTALSAASENDRERVYMTDSTQPTKMFRIFDDVNGGATNDAGVTNNALIQTPFMRLAGGTKFKVHRVRLAVLSGNTNTVTLRARWDGASSDTAVRTATPTAGALQQLDFNRLGSGRSLSLIVEQNIGAGQFPSNYEPQAHLEDRLEIIGLMVEFLPVGEN